MNQIDRDAVGLIVTQLRNLIGNIDRGEVTPTMLSVVALDDDDGRPSGEYNISVTVRPQAQPTPAERFMEKHARRDAE